MNFLAYSAGEGAKENQRDCFCGTEMCLFIWTWHKRILQFQVGRSEVSRWISGGLPVAHLVLFCP